MTNWSTTRRRWKRKPYRREYGAAHRAKRRALAPLVASGEVDCARCHQRIQPGQEKPGDLIFWDSYLGPNQIGHVMIVWNRANKTTIEARGTRAGVGHSSYANGPRHRTFEIWRVGNLARDRR